MPGDVTGDHTAQDERAFGREFISGLFRVRRYPNLPKKKGNNRDAMGYDGDINSL